MFCLLAVVSSGLIAAPTGLVCNGCRKFAARLPAVVVVSRADWTAAEEWPDGETLLAAQQRAKAEAAALDAAVAAEDYAEASRLKALVAALRDADPLWTLRAELQSAVRAQDFALAARCKAALRRLRVARPRLLWRDSLLVLRSGRELWVYTDRGRGKLLYRSPRGSAIATPTWSPDGEYVAAAEAGGGRARVVVFSVEDGSEVASAPTPPVFFMAWSPDGAHITFLHAEPKPVPGGPSLVLGSLSLRKRKASYLRPGGPLFYALGRAGALLVHNGFLQARAIQRSTRRPQSAARRI